MNISVLQQKMTNKQKKIMKFQIGISNKLQVLSCKKIQTCNKTCNFKTKTQCEKTSGKDDLRIFSQICNIKIIELQQLMTYLPLPRFPRVKVGKKRWKFQKVRGNPKNLSKTHSNLSKHLYLKAV